LAVSGVVVQSIMRNPLASPDTLGLSSGSGLAAVAVTILLPLASPSVLSAAAFAGGSLVFVIVYLLAYKKGVEPIR
ncbi:iron chelate uptake ABC transporter family permease subunit, partial [Bacillus subtilis]|nr:iron chelate uptake ABC transporter family permease subunit [Bacillus subtilis]